MLRELNMSQTIKTIKLKRILASRYSNLNWTQKLCTIILWSYVTQKKNQSGETYFFKYEMLCINILYSCQRNQFYEIGLAHKILLGFYIFLKLWKSAALCYVRKKPISNLKIHLKLLDVSANYWKMGKKVNLLLIPLDFSLLSYTAERFYTPPRWQGAEYDIPLSACCILST